MNRGRFILYPFWMMMPERKYSAANSYRYGFNGKENDNEVKGEGAQYDYGFRIYDPRLGRFLSVDPLTKSYPELTPYQFASNTPIEAIDLDGLESESSKKDGFWKSFGKTVLNGISDAYKYLANNPNHASYDINPKKLSKEDFKPYETNWSQVLDPTWQIQKFSENLVYGTTNYIGGIIEGDGEKTAQVIPVLFGSLPVGKSFGPLKLQSATSSILGNLFKAPVDAQGWLKAAGVVEATLIKGEKGGKVAVIGQGMDKVKQVANGLKNPEVFTPTEGALKQWNKLLADNPGKVLSEDLVKSTKIFKENEIWINNVKKEGYDILDTGGGTTSTFYNMEKQAVYGTGIKKQ